MTLTHPLAALARRALVAALVAAAVADARAQQAPTAPPATYVLLLGNDTLGLERASFGLQRIDGEMLDKLRGMRVVYSVAFDVAGNATRVDTRIYRPATDTTLRQHAVIELHADTAVATIEGTSTVQRIPTRVGALPYLNPSIALLDPVVARARGSASPVDVPLLQIVGGMTVPIRVTWQRGDSAEVVIGGVTGYVRTGADGHVSEFAVPAQRFRAVRASSDVRLTLAPPDYSAPPGAPYTAESVTVRTAAGLTLAGTLTLPAKRPPRGVPAVVTITGSGAQDRDESIPIVSGYRPFRQVADTLARRGIAVLRLDDRGIGGSDPGPATATSADYAQDVRAALAWLRARPEIDSTRLALVGHSEGGMIAPMVATQDGTVRAVVLMAGPSRTGRRILEYQQRYAIDHDTALTPARRDSLRATMAARLDSAAQSSPWIRFFLDYDPVATARQVRVPVLILQGATDRQVTADQAEELAAAFRAGGNRRVTVRVFPETNHLFVADPNGDPSRYGSLHTTGVRREVLGAIADWLSTQLR